MADISFPIYGEVYAKNGDKIAPNTLKVEQGWVQEMMPFQYENWLQNRQDVAITYLLQKGIPEYNAAQEYVANKSAVLYVGAVYLATVNGVLDLPTNTSQWRKLSVALDSNGIVPVASGGTGASTPSQARTNLGLGTASTLNADFVVQKDVNGNFSAGIITATLSGNATTSSSWLTGRTVSLSGAVTGTSSAWKGDGNLTITTTSLDATKLIGEVPSASLPLVVKKSSDTGIAYIPMGTTSERPVPTAPGTRINSTTGMIEYWNGSAWLSVTGGAESYFNSQLQTKVDIAGSVMTGNLTVPSLNGGQLAGMRNKIINPFTENQRALTSVGDDAYCLDRWYVLTESGNITVAKIDDPETGAPAAIRLTQPDVSVKRFGIAQIIESKNIKPYRTTAMNFSARVKSSFSGNVRYAIIEHTGAADVVTSDVVNDWASTSFTSGGFFIAGLTVLKTGVVAPGASVYGDISDWSALGESTNNVIVFVWTEAAQAQNATLEINRPQYEPGTIKTPHEWRLNELELCQRYYEAISGAPTRSRFSAPGASVMVLQTATVSFATKKRAVPTINLLSYIAGGVPAPSSISTSGFSVEAVPDSNGVLSFYWTSSIEL